jgi:hypothetical protein
MGTSGAQFIAFTTGLLFSNSRNSTPPQRIHLFRGFATETDITIPHEHSMTGMPHTPVPFAWPT